MTRGIPIGELQLLLDAGLTPMEVIETATRHAARACGHEDEVGTLEPGKLGDLIVVPGNPLQDVNAFSQISLVIKDGMIAYQPKGS
jgi:imidazolonepropionase-like amidohydrolase